MMGNNRILENYMRQAELLSVSGTGKTAMPLITSKNVPLLTYINKPLLKNQGIETLLLPWIPAKDTGKLYLTEQDSKKTYDQINALKTVLESSVKLMEQAVSAKNQFVFWREFEWVRFISDEYTKLYKSFYDVNENEARKSIDGLCKRREVALTKAYVLRIA